MNGPEDRLLERERERDHDLERVSERERCGERESDQDLDPDLDRVRERPRLLPLRPPSFDAFLRSLDFDGWPPSLSPLSSVSSRSRDFPRLCLLRLLPLPLDPPRLLF